MVPGKLKCESRYGAYLIAAVIRNFASACSWQPCECYRSTIRVFWGKFWGSQGQDAYRGGQLWCRTECCVTLKGGLVLFQEFRENTSLYTDNNTKPCCMSVLLRLIVNGSLVKPIVGSPRQLRFAVHVCIISLAAHRLSVVF